MHKPKITWANFFHIYQPPNWSFHIINKVARESYRPLLKSLLRNKNIKITLNVSGSLTEQLYKHGHADIIKNIKKLVQKKQIEMTGTAMYHPLLPLIPEQEVIRQIKLNNIINKKYFGKAYQPRGFFPPEMAYSNTLGKTVKKMGFKWIIVDEIAAYGRLGRLDFNKKYALKNGLSVVFRNRMVSDYISFRSKLNQTSGFWQEINRDGRSNNFLITAMDGENLGHHRKNLDKFWYQLVTDSNVNATTISDLLGRYKKRQTKVPKKSSWSSREQEIKTGIPYVLWQDSKNPIHAAQWLLTNEIIKLVNKNQGHKNYKEARPLLDKRLASDQYWWASAKPWWSLQIIKKKTLELLAISTLLQPNNREIKKIANKIITLAQNWQKTSKFIKIKKIYLASIKSVRYIGGKKITEN